MTDTTAQIAAKGCAATGITEDLAASLHNTLGKKLMAVVELEVATRSENADGKEKVGLRILTVEPAPNHDTETHLRNLQRSFHYERKLADGQLEIQTGADLEPNVTDVLAAGKAHEPHDFIPSEVDNQCEACGQNPLAAVHQADDQQQPQADDTDDPGDEAEDDDTNQPDDDHQQPTATTRPITTIPDPWNAA